jgi:5-methylcytosine-specific restriction enzyme A
MSPRALLLPCSRPMCPHMKPCPLHGARPADYGRPSDPFYSSAAWKRLRAKVRKHQPLCCACLGEGRAVPSGMVEHLVPRTQDPSRELDYANLAGLCASCANRKTAFERTGNLAGLTEMVALIGIGREQQEAPWSGSNWRPLAG